MDKPVVGMAVKITENNRDKIAFVNGGVVPELELPLHQGYYFIFPYDADLRPSILPGYVFWANYDFTERESEDRFIDIVEI